MPACHTGLSISDSTDLGQGPQDSGAGDFSVAPIDLAVGGVDQVPCGQNMTCSTLGDHACCEQSGGPTCQARPCPSMTFVTLACDGPEDCHGLACCYDVAVSAIECRPDCGNNYRICHSKADCRPGECCLQLEASAPVSGCLATTGC